MQFQRESPSGFRITRRIHPSVATLAQKCRKLVKPETFLNPCNKRLGNDTARSPPQSRTYR